MPAVRKKNKSGRFLVPAVLLMTACAGNLTYVTDPIPPAQRIEPPSQTITVRKPLPTPSRGGGYYKDDGPAEDIPENLDSIPDAQPRPELLHRFANRPYSVLGKSYVPNTSLKPFRQRGIASWYGKKFHGQKTSIGEPYDMFSMTAAHPTLAIPSYARVSNVSTGKSVVVRITDRGPFHADRIIDLSYAAAYRLGYINHGSTLVDVESILPGDPLDIKFAQASSSAPSDPYPAGTHDAIEALATKHTSETATFPNRATLTAPAATQTGLFLQLGAFSSAENAESLRLHLSRELDWLGEAIQINAGGTLYRVHLGPYASRAEAERAAERIHLQLGYKPSFVSR